MEYIDEEKYGQRIGENDATRSGFADGTERRLVGVLFVDAPDVAEGSQKHVEEFRIEMQQYLLFHYC